MTSTETPGTNDSTNGTDDRYLPDHADGVDSASAPSDAVGGFDPSLHHLIENGTPVAPDQPATEHPVADNPPANIPATDSVAPVPADQGPMPAPDPTPPAAESPVAEPTVVVPAAPVPSAPEPAETKQVEVPSSTTPTPVAPVPAKRSLVRRFFRMLFKIVIVLAVIGAIVAAVVFGYPEFDERVLQRVDANASDTAQLEDDLASANQRIDELEARAGVLESDLEGGADDMAALSDRIDADLQAQDGEIAAQRQISQSMDLLARARLYLYQANYGFAQQDIIGARNILAVAAEAPDADPGIASAIERLDAAAAALPAQPLIANDEVNVAWQLLLGGTATSTPAVIASPDIPAGAAPVDPAPSDPPAPGGDAPAGAPTPNS